MRLLDRRQHDVDAIVATISDWIAAALPGRPSTGRRATYNRSTVATCDERKLLAGNYIVLIRS
jgi:hypothetical protein